jgi:hypothetical protein
MRAGHHVSCGRVDAGGQGSPDAPATQSTGDLTVSLYFFRISSDKYSGVAQCPYDLLDHDAAWKQMTKASSDVISGICRNLKPETDWRLELVDEAGKPRMRIRLVAETLE